MAVYGDSTHNLSNLPPQIYNEVGTMDKSRLVQIERYIVNFFRESGHTRILARELFDLEKHERLLVRHTTEGNDYISLTAQGVVHLGLEEAEVEDELPALPHPPKSATKMV
jgi:hypothetical protein